MRQRFIQSGHATKGLSTFGVACGRSIHSRRSAHPDGRCVESQFAKTTGCANVVRLNAVARLMEGETVHEASLCGTLRLNLKASSSASRSRYGLKGFVTYA